MWRAGSWLPRSNRPQAVPDAEASQATATQVIFPRHASIPPMRGGRHTEASDIADYLATAPALTKT